MPAPAFRRAALFVLAFALLVPPTYSADLNDWSELAHAYNDWRPYYAPIVPPLSADVAQISDDINRGSFAFIQEPEYYIDIGAGAWSYAAGGPIAAAIHSGVWVYAIEDITTAQVLIMNDAGAQLTAFPAEPWPTANTDEVFLQELNKRRVVLWFYLRADNAGRETSASASAPAEPAAMLEDEGGGASSTNCDPCMQDIDGDGVPNREEIFAGTDPYNATSYFRFGDFVWSNAALVYTWYGVTNREYLLETGSATNYGNSYPFSNVVSWLTGYNTDIVYSDAVVRASQDFAVSRLLVRGRDSNTNGIPDWWEIQQYGHLTNINYYGDDDGDGLENHEEMFYGYSPTNSERVLYHSAFKMVTVSTNMPAVGPDEGNERFDFSGLGRPLSLASGAQDTSYVRIGEDPNDTSPRLSGGIFFNNDLSNLYVGVSGIHCGYNNRFALFIDTGSGGVTNLRHLSTSLPPYGFSRARNFNFDATAFTPSVGILVGSRFVDGSNDPNESVSSASAGQGVYYLTNNGNFAGFNTTGGCALSQWGTNGYYGDDGVSAHEGIEVALSLTALGVQPGATIKIAGLFIGGNDGSNRWSSAECYGKTYSGGEGYGQVTIVGSEVQLAAIAQTAPSCTYSGFTDDDIVFQGFYWDTVPLQGWYNLLRTQLVSYATSGFTMVWLPVPVKADNPQYSMGYAPYDQYDLGEYSYQYRIETRFGSKSQLTNLLASLLATNLTPICDVVLNHMGGSLNPTNYNTFTNYPHGNFFKTANDFHPSSVGHNDQLFPYHYNFLFGGTNAHPLDVDVLSPNMRLGFKQWGDWLATNINYRGWRIDFSEGVEPWYLYEWFNYPGQRPYFAFMEYWKFATGRDMQDWLDLTGRKAAIYDWNLQQMLEEMCEQDGVFDMNLLKAPSLLGREPNYTLTFVENHDTLQPDGTNTPVNHRGVSRQKQLAYAYCMHSAGLPIVFYHDYFLPPYFNVTNGTYEGSALKPEIDRLMLIRKRTVAGAGQYLSTNSDVFVQQRDGGGIKSPSILIINDQMTGTTNIQIQTIFTTNTVLMDLVDTVSPNSVTTDVSGVVMLECPARGYRIYGLPGVLDP